MWCRQKLHASCSLKKRGMKEPTRPVFVVKVGGEIIFERTDSWGRTGDWGAVETVWILNNCSKKFSRESTRGLPAAVQAQLRFSFPELSEIIYFHRIQKMYFSKLIIK